MNSLEISAQNMHKTALYVKDRAEFTFTYFWYSDKGNLFSFLNELIFVYTKDM